MLNCIFNLNRFKSKSFPWASNGGVPILLTETSALALRFVKGVVAVNVLGTGWTPNAAVNAAEYD